MDFQTSHIMFYDNHKDHSFIALSEKGSEKPQIYKVFIVYKTSKILYRSIKSNVATKSFTYRHYIIKFNNQEGPFTQ